MKYRRVKGDDLAQINRLLKQYWDRVWDGSEINPRDVAVGAFSDHGACHGVIWVGLMQKNRLGYVDYYVTDPEFARKGVGQGLARTTFGILQKLGVERVFGVINTDEFHDRSAINALRIGMGAKARPHTLVFGELKTMGKEID